MSDRCVIDLFAGIGGFSLAASANGVRPIVQVEIDAFLLAGLTRAWPYAKHHDDIKTFDAKPYRGIWAVMGGPPCQPASRAGKQQGAADERWLWNQAIRVVAESEPAWFLFENPPGILDVGLDGILSDLEGLGYEVQPISIPACAVNSPQDRDRIWIVGNRSGIGSETGIADSQTGEMREPGQHDDATQDLALGHSQKGNGSISVCGRRPDEGMSELGRPTQDGHLANGCEGTHCRPNQQGRDGQARAKTEVRPWTDFCWLPCPDGKGGTVVRRAPVGLYDVAHGLQLELPKGVGSKLIAALGNSIVWQVAAEIIAAMIQAEKT